MTKLRLPFSPPQPPGLDLRQLGLPVRKELPARQQSRYNKVLKQARPVRTISSAQYQDVALLTALVHGVERVLLELPPQVEETAELWCTASEAVADYLVAYTKRFSEQRPDGTTDDVAHDSASVLTTILLHAGTVAVGLCDLDQASMAAWLEDGANRLRAARAAQVPAGMGVTDAGARIAA